MPKTRSLRGLESVFAAKGRLKAPRQGLKALKSHAFFSLAPHMKAASLASSRSALLKRELLTLTSELGANSYLYFRFNFFYGPHYSEAVI